MRRRRLWLRFVRRLEDGNDLDARTFVTATAPCLNIYGTGGFARQVLPSVLALQEVQKAADVQDFGSIAFVDDNPSGQDMLGVAIRSPAEMSGGEAYLLAIANGHTREVLAQRCDEAGLVAYSMISPVARVAIGAAIGTGATLCDFSIIEPFVKIGTQFQCNIYSYVAHDCVIGDYVTFAPRVSCNGNVHIGDYAYIGTGAVIKQGSPDKPLLIGKGAVIGMGAVVTKDVPPGATVIGNPARIRS
jgi:sugar O-acyltransferase (sialic acid O-acetyltransferase NeuD family)